MSPFSSSPVGPLWMEMPVSRAFFTYPPGSPVRESLLQVPLTELPQGERRSTSRVPFIHLAKSLVNEPRSRFPSRALMKRDVLLQSLFYITFIRLSKSVHGAPRGRKTYLPWGAAWFPKGIDCDTAIITPVPCSLQHHTFHLGLCKTEPRYPECVVVTLIRLSPPHVLPPPT